MEQWGIYSAQETKEQFVRQQESVKNLSLDFWKSIITVQATILGISIALWGHTEITPSIILKITWLLEILSIIQGFLLFNNHLEIENRNNYETLKYSLNMQEIQNLENKGEFKSRNDMKAGMLIATIMSIIPKKEQSFWKPYAYELAEKYKAQLPSKQLFKEYKISKFRNLLIEHNQKLITSFYMVSACSFLTLMISILLR